jgi:hypothetical protein
MSVGTISDQAPQVDDAAATIGAEIAWRAAARASWL